MIEGIPRISVVVITYNQENVIERTLDSLIKQNKYIYEICVSDDCSSDNTWNILLGYQRKYPTLIKIHRNNCNVGIFENIEKSWTMPTGDVINRVAGDDASPIGWYKKVVDFIKNNNLDWENELFCIYGDFIAIYPNGDSMVFKNSSIKKKPKDALRLSIRGIICGRGCCFSKKVLDKFENVSVGRSHIAETAQDRQLQLFSETNYYIPALANVYYTKIGVSAHVNREIFQERFMIWPYAEKYLKSKGVYLRKVDNNYGRYYTSMQKFAQHRSIINFMRMLWCYLISRDINLLFYGNSFRHLIFALLRRLPHKKPLCFN